MAEKSWKTCDIKTVAFLLYSGFHVKGVASDHGRAVFLFDDTEERRTAVLDFCNKKKNVEPVAFIECQNRARDMVTQAMQA